MLLHSSGKHPPTAHNQAVPLPASLGVQDENSLPLPVSWNEIERALSYEYPSRGNNRAYVLGCNRNYHCRLHT